LIAADTPFTSTISTDRSVGSGSTSRLRLARRADSSSAGDGPVDTSKFGAYIGGYAPALAAVQPSTTLYADTPIVGNILTQGLSPRDARVSNTPNPASDTQTAINANSYSFIKSGQQYKVLVRLVSSLFERSLSRFIETDRASFIPKQCPQNYRRSYARRLLRELGLLPHHFRVKLRIPQAYSSLIFHIPFLSSWILVLSQTHFLTSDRIYSLFIFTPISFSSYVFTALSRLKAVPFSFSFGSYLSSFCSTPALIGTHGNSMFKFRNTLFAVCFVSKREQGTKETRKLRRLSQESNSCRIFGSTLSLSPRTVSSK